MAETAKTPKKKEKDTSKSSELRQSSTQVTVERGKKKQARERIEGGKSKRLFKKTGAASLLSGMQKKESV